jgi:hypothetical protein
MDYSIIRSIYSAIEPALDELMTFDVRDMLNRIVEYATEMADGQSISDYLPKVRDIVCVKYNIICHSGYILQSRGRSS